MGCNFQRYELEGAIEFLPADKDEDQGQYGEHNHNWSVVEFFHSKVSNHSNLIQQKSTYQSHMYMRPHSPIALIGWDINLQRLSNKSEQQYYHTIKLEHPRSHVAPIFRV